MNASISPPSGSSVNIRAVTLVEILVYIGIVAILAALMFPAIRRLEKAGKDTKCLSNHRSIIQAVLIYAADHNGTLPGNRIAGANDGGGLTAEKLSPYLDVEWRNDKRWTDQWLCPSLPREAWLFPYSYYAFNIQLFGQASVGEGPKNISAITKPSKSGAFACVVANYGLFHSYAFTHLDNPSSGNATRGQLSSDHSGGGTVISFMDGHSQLVRPFGKGDPRQNWFFLNHSNVP